MANRLKYSCDFETTTKIEDCRVWAWRYTEIGNKHNNNIGNNIESFMEWVAGANADLYFHNLRFDGEFIVNWLLKNGFTYSDSGLPMTFKATISAMGQWYFIDICFGYKGKKKQHTVIYDSLKKLPFPVKKIAIDFKMDILKGDIDYHKKRPVGYELDAEEIAYLENDTEIIADALKVQFDQGLTAMTNGSDSLKGFKDIISKKKFEKLFPVFSLEMDKDIRMSYRGGFTWLNDRFSGKEVGEGLVFDVNSLYPAQMYTRPLPYGMPIFYDGEYEHDENYPLYIQHIRCGFQIKDGYIPTVQIKKNLLFKQNEYLKSSNGDIVDLYMTNVDMEMFLEHYETYDLTHCEGWKFRSSTGIFNKFIDKWTYIKITEKGAKKLLAKLMLNSLYGKFASNPNVTGKIPYLKPDGSCGFAEGEEDYKDPIYTPMGVFITSWARYTTIGTAQKCFDRIIYCDTDSIHLTGTEMPEAIKDIIDDDKLGYWQHESTFQRAKYIRQKTYAQELIVKPYIKYDKIRKAMVETNVKLSVKCAGMPERVKEKVSFRNFEVGFKSGGKLLPKHVSGGVVLMDTEFTIK